MPVWHHANDRKNAMEKGVIRALSSADDAPPKVTLAGRACMAGMSEDYFRSRSRTSLASQCGKCLRTRALSSTSKACQSTGSFAATVP